MWWSGEDKKKFLKKSKNPWNPIVWMCEYFRTLKKSKNPSSFQEWLSGGESSKKSKNPWSYQMWWSMEDKKFFFKSKNPWIPIVWKCQYCKKWKNEKILDLLVRRSGKDKKVFKTIQKSLNSFGVEAWINNIFHSKFPKSKKSNVTVDFCTTFVEYFHSLEEFRKNPKITFLSWISLKSFG